LVKNKEDGGLSKGEGGKRNVVLIFFFDARLSEKWLVIRSVTNERVWEYLHVNEFSLARVSLRSTVESDLLTQEYGYFHMLYLEVNKSCP